MSVRLVLYWLFILAGAAASGISGYITGKKKGLPAGPLRIYIISALLFGIAGAFMMGQLQNFIMSLTGLPFYESRMRIFGGLLFTPLFMFFVVKYLAGDFSLVSDVIAPGAYLILGFSKIGCAVYGCCYGIPWEYGVPSQFENHLCFPVQLLESVLCFILYGLMLYLVLKGRLPEGTAYGLTLLLYGIVRFCAEFLRYYPEAEKTFFLGISFWQIISITAAVIGAGMMLGRLRIRRKQKAEITFS